MKMTLFPRALLLFGACSIPLVLGFGRTEIPLNDEWRFALAPAATGVSDPAFDDHGWRQIELPHTWNAIDGADGGNSYVRGDGWYRKHFTADPSWRSSRVVVDFGAAGRVAEVWLNGRRLGEHRGAYARFRFDLTGALRFDADNVLVVRVNNEPNEIVPLGGDFTMWGGLHRTVKLIVAAPTHLALMDHGSPGVYISTPAISEAVADVHVRAVVERMGGASFSGQVHVAIHDAADAVVAEGVAPVEVTAESTVSAEQIVHLSKPHLWNGRADPYLYRVVVELRDSQSAIDRVVQPLGVRAMTVDPDKGLFLNGRHYAAHGVNRHPDWQDRGIALTPRQMEFDFGLLEEIGATVVRLCHYQHDDYEYALADADGLLVWAEEAFVGPPPTTGTGADNAVEQLRELIRQNFNHPSIFCWSVGNETSAGADPLIARLAAVVKEEDPSRFSTYASHHEDNDPRNSRTDLVGYNKYYGWYCGSYEEFGRWLDTWHAEHQRRPLAISEYGAGSSTFQHEQNPPARPRTQARGPWHPEEWQNEYHENAWLTLSARPYLWGTFIWCLVDFASDGRNEGDTLGRNDKGLVTYDRATRKDAFYWYKANWSDTPFVYLTSRRDSLRLESKTDVKVYSNCDTVELWLNGRSLGAMAASDHRFIWRGVTLEPGSNRLVVKGAKSATTVTDACAWTLANGTPYRPPTDPTK